MQRRQFLGHAGAAAGSLLLASSTRSAIAASGRAAFDAFVSLAPGRGVHAYPSVGAAILSAPLDGTRPYRIGIDAGNWREKILVDRPHIHLIGVHRQACVLSHDTAAGTLKPDGEPWGTWGCASVIVRAPDFRASNLTIENAFDYIGNLAAPKFAPIGPNGAQAVALLLDKGSDRAVLRDVDLRGHQDTLFCEAGRSLFRDCRISGSVDFIFGAGRALFERCDLQSRFRPDKPRQGYVAVPSTPRSQEHGLVFERCRLVRERSVPDASVALGRAWRPGRQFPDGKYGDPDALGSAVYRSCWMDAHIAPEGWDEMAYSLPSGERVMLQPNDARLYEYDSRGPGAHRSATRRWLDAAQAERHAPARVLEGWTVPPA
jgi:pectinesterase